MFDAKIDSFQSDSDSDRGSDWGYDSGFAFKFDRTCVQHTKVVMIPIADILCFIQQQENLRYVPRRAVFRFKEHMDNNISRYNSNISLRLYGTCGHGELVKETGIR